MSITIPPPGLREGIAEGLTAERARWLVDFYYAVQDYRIQASGQVRSIKQDADQGPQVPLFEWVLKQMEVSEKEISKALSDYSNGQVAGRWARTITGIGPTLAAGLLAHIDIERAPTAGHIWSFAGLNPEMKWEKGQKRPYNAKLKVICWRIGDSFVKQSGRAYETVTSESTDDLERAASKDGIDEEERAVQTESAVQEEPVDNAESAGVHERAVSAESTMDEERADRDESTGPRERAASGESADEKERADESESTVSIERVLLAEPAKPEDLYCWLYARRKKQEIERNDAGVFSAQAARSLLERKIRDKGLRATYEAGKLPPGRLDLRARRYAVKLFLAHLHHVLYEDHFEESPPKPYILTREEHVHYIGPPGWPL
jgi:transposase IS116/IS110/IS902 family protein